MKVCTNWRMPPKACVETPARIENSVRLSGRNTQGVRLMRLEPGDHTVAVAIVRSEEEAAGKETDDAQMTLDEQTSEAQPESEKSKGNKKPKESGKPATKGAAQPPAQAKPGKKAPPVKPGRSKKK